MSNRLWQLINQAVDYSSSGALQAEDIAYTLKQNDLLNVKLYTLEMQQVLATTIDRYLVMMNNGYGIAPLEDVVVCLFRSWNVITDDTLQAEEV